MSRLDGSVSKFFEKVAKTDLLILDDFGLTLLEQQQLMDFMKMIEDRHGRTSTIIASQLPVANWYNVSGEKTIADAILDRLVHAFCRIELKKESLIKKGNIVSSSCFLNHESIRGGNIRIGGQHRRNIHRAHK